MDSNEIICIFHNFRVTMCYFDFIAGVLKIVDVICQLANDFYEKVYFSTFK